MTIVLVELSPAEEDWAQTLLLAQELQTQQSAHGQQLVLACPAGSTLAARANSSNISLLELDGQQGVLSLCISLYKYCKRHTPVMLHSFDPRSLQICAILHRFKHLPLIHTVRQGWKIDRWSRWSLRQVDLFVQSSAGLVSFFDAAGIPPEKCRTILPVLAPAFVSSGRGSVGITAHQAEKHFVFMAAAPLVPEKNIQALLQAAADLQDMSIDLPAWELRIVGDGPLFSTLLESAATLGITHRLGMLGTQSREEMLRTADAVVIPTASGVGDIPFLLESWNLGVPVTCTALAAHRDVTVNNENVLLVDPEHSVAPLVGAMLKLIREPELRDRLIEGGRKALIQFSPARMVAEYGEAYAVIEAKKQAQ